MSWVKSISFSGEDVFDENADELNLQSKEWTSNMKKRLRVSACLLTFSGTSVLLQVYLRVFLSVVHWHTDYFSVDSLPVEVVFSVEYSQYE